MRESIITSIVVRFRVEKERREKRNASRVEQNIDAPIPSACIYREHSLLCEAAATTTMTTTSRRESCTENSRLLYVESTKIADRARPSLTDGHRRWLALSGCATTRTLIVKVTTYNRADYSRRSTTYARYDLSFSLSFSFSLSLSLVRARTSLSLTVRIKRNVTQISVPQLRPIYATHDLYRQEIPS